MLWLHAQISSCTLATVLSKFGVCILKALGHTCPAHAPSNENTVHLRPHSPDDFFFKCSGRCSTLVRVTISTPLAEKTLVSTPFIFSALSLRKPQMPLFCLQWMREPKDPYYRQMQDRH